MFQFQVNVIRCWVCIAGTREIHDYREFDRGVGPNQSTKQIYDAYTGAATFNARVACGPNGRLFFTVVFWYN